MNEIKPLIVIKSSEPLNEKALEIFKKQHKDLANDYHLLILDPGMEATIMTDD